MASGCTTKYVAPEANPKTTASLEIELLTKSSAGGVGTGIGTQERCVAEEYLGYMNYGYLFSKDIRVRNTHIPANQEVTLSIAVNNTVAYRCKRTIVFTPLPGQSYRAEFEYGLPRCRIRMYETKNSEWKPLSPERVSECP